MKEIDIVTYLIQQGEKALAEAKEASAKESESEEMEALINELLALKYHDALRSFEDALKLDKDNEAAIEGFCYSLANAVLHYEQAGLTGLSETIKVKAMQYPTKKTREIANRSSRLSIYLLEAIQDVINI